MLAIPKRRRLLGRAVLCAGLALAGLGFATGVATAFPSQPVPADDPFIPVDPGTLVPAAPNTGTLLTNAGSMLPLLNDAGSFLSAGQDPNALVNDTQNILNDAGSMLGLPDTSSWLSPISDLGGNATTTDASTTDVPPPDPGND